MRRSGIALGGRPDDNRPIHGRAAHARIPGGPETLVILEGLTLENKAPTGRALWLPRWAHKRYTRDYTVYQVARRPGLPAGHTTRDMADDYASWIGANVVNVMEAARLVGMASGGKLIPIASRPAAA